MNKGLILRFLSLILITGLLLIPTGLVSAHAELVRSTPGAGQSLGQFPTTITLEFSEGVDPTTARAALLDSSGKTLAQGTPSLEPGSETVLRVEVPAQPDGIYTLDWQVASSDDGHITTGSLPFSVGASEQGASLLPPVGTVDPSAALPSAPESILRWLGYLSVALLAGSSLFAVLVWRPAFRAQGQALAAWDERLLKLLRRLMLAGVIGAVISIVGVAAAQALQLNSAALRVPFWQAFFEQIGHHASGLFWVRVLALALVGGFLSLLPPPGSGSAHRWWEMVIYNLVLLATFSLSGHNAAQGGVLGVVGDFIHITAMSAWVGGLAPLALLLVWNRRDPSGVANGVVASAAGRFSRLALISVIAVALTGLYSALLQVRDLNALVSTRYGQAVIVKTALFALLIILGAVNQLGLLPKQRLNRLGSTVRVEIGIAAALLAAVGALMSLPPAYEAVQADARLGYHQTYNQDGVRIDFRIAPAQVGTNEFAVDVVDMRPGADKVPAEVHLNFLAPFVNRDNMTTVHAEAAGGGRYLARGTYFSMKAFWEVEVVLSREGFKDVRPEFKIDLSK